MNKKFLITLVLLVTLLLIGCSNSSTPSVTTMPQDLTEKVATDEPITTPPPPDLTENGPSPVETEEPTLPVVEIIHENIPGNSKYSTTERIDDCSTGERIELGATTLIGQACDNWKKAKLERPADAPNGTYYPMVDIIRAEMGTNQIWMFAKINLYKAAAGQLPSELNLGFEIDTDLDSRGDYLIVANGLTSSEWTTEGVQVWWDQTDDVGGDKPHMPDRVVGDGYETLLFDSGQGLDADLAWVRINPDNGASVEFAFKPNLLPENKVFVWWAWATLKTISPVDMEIVDSQEDSESWMIDNTCSKIFNGKPSKLIVNICDFVVPLATPTPTIIPGNASESSSSSGCVVINCQAAHPGDPPGSWEWNSSTCSCQAIN